MPDSIDAKFVCAAVVASPESDKELEDEASIEFPRDAIPGAYAAKFTGCGREASVGCEGVVCAPATVKAAPAITATGRLRRMALKSENEVNILGGLLAAVSSHAPKPAEMS